MAPRSDIRAAIEDLRNREHTDPESIGFVALAEPSRHSQVYPDAAQGIGKWAIKNDFDAVIWADLPGNFADKRGSAFSVSEAIRYLIGLKEPSAGMAREYFLRAPLEIITPLRERLWVHPWLWS